MLPYKTTDSQPIYNHLFEKFLAPVESSPGECLIVDSLLILSELVCSCWKCLVGSQLNPKSENLIKILGGILLILVQLVCTCDEAS